MSGIGYLRLIARFIQRSLRLVPWSGFPLRALIFNLLENRSERETGNPLLLRVTLRQELPLLPSLLSNNGLIQLYIKVREYFWLWFLPLNTLYIERNGERNREIEKEELLKL